MRIKNYFKYLLEILKYYDVQPLLLFWCVSDILNNQVLWTTPSYWVDAGQPNTYYLYLAYLLVSVGIFTSMYCIRRCTFFVSSYLLLTLFASIRYVVSLVTDSESSFDIDDLRSLTITFFYLLIWTWIWVKLQREMLYRKMKK